MRAEKKRDTNIGVGVGLLLQLIGRVMQFQGAAGLGFVLVLAGLALFVWGCVNYCQGKGCPGLLGLIGLLSLIGLLVSSCSPTGTGAHRERVGPCLRSGVKPMLECALGNGKENHAARGCRRRGWDGGISGP